MPDTLDGSRCSGLFAPAKNERSIPPPTSSCAPQSLTLHLAQASPLFRMGFPFVLIEVGFGMAQGMEMVKQVQGQLARKTRTRLFSGGHEARRDGRRRPKYRHAPHLVTSSPTATQIRRTRPESGRWVSTGGGKRRKGVPRAAVPFQRLPRCPHLSFLVPFSIHRRECRSPLEPTRAPTALSKRPSTPPLARRSR